MILLPGNPTGRRGRRPGEGLWEGRGGRPWGALLPGPHNCCSSDLLRGPPCTADLCWSCSRGTASPSDGARCRDARGRRTRALWPPTGSARDVSAPQAVTGASCSPRGTRPHAPEEQTDRQRLPPRSGATCGQSS